MNNIEILEEYIKEVWKPKPIHNVIPDWATIEKEEIQAIENLIQENKELKEKNKKYENKIKAVLELIDTKPYTAYTLYGDILYDDENIKELLEGE